MAASKPRSPRAATATGSGFRVGLHAHHRLLICAAIGIAVGLLTPGIETWLSRALVGWNTLVWLYLASVAVTIWRAPMGHMKQLAEAQAESAFTVLLVVVFAAVVSLVAVVLELHAVKGEHAREAAPHIAFALATVVGSWLMLPILFSLNYAARYFARTPDGGLSFPGDRVEPQHGDFLYFSFTIAVASQTADVAITSRELRRLVTAHALLSFLFNTTILAFSINAAAQFF